MAVQLDYLQALIERGVVFDPSDVALLPRRPSARWSRCLGRVGACG